MSAAVALGYAVAERPAAVPATRLAAFSGIGSAPLHLVPVIVWTLAERGVALPFASLVAAAAVFGTFCASAALASWTRPRWGANEVLALIVLHAATIVAAGLMPNAALPVAWFAVGAISGVYMQMGVVGAAASRDPFASFVVRLGATLLLAGAIALAVALVPAGDRFLALCLAYAAVLALAYAALIGHRAVDLGAPAARPVAASPQVGRRSAVALGMIFLTSAAITTFLSQVGVYLADATASAAVLPAVVIGAAKIAGGAVLVALFCGLRRALCSGVVRAASFAALCLLVTLPVEGALAAVGFMIAFEVLANLSSSYVFTRVAGVLPPARTRLVLLFILCGGAAGPVVGSFLVEVGSFGLVRAATVAAFLVVCGWLAASAASASRQGAVA